MVNPLDLLADGFPHGTIEGERQGCVGSNCPAKPNSCMFTAMRYRTDMRFRKAYQAGARGDELPTEEQLRTEDIQHTPPPPTELVFKTLSRVEQDNELVRRRDAKQSLVEIAAWAGMTVGGIQYRYAKRNVDRPDADRGKSTLSPAKTDPAPTTVRSKDETPIAPATTPSAIASDDQAPASILELDQRGPRVVQLWVVLDKRDKLVMGSTSYTTALEHLAREASA